MNYKIIFCSSFKKDIRLLGKKYRNLIITTITEQTTFEPGKETRNRKKLRQENPDEMIIWEIRFGPDNSFRIFYRIIENSREIEIIAIGIKKREQLFLLRN